MLNQATKDSIFRISGSLLRRWPLAFLARKYFRNRAAILFYHAVWHPSDERMQLFPGMRFRNFIDDMQRLARFFRFVPLSDIIHNRVEPSSRPPIAITFDDGFDLSTVGVTTFMADMGIRATMFVNTASLAGEHLMWMHRFSAIRARKGDEVLRRELGIASLDDLIATTRAWPQEEKEERTNEIWNAAEMGSVKNFVSKHKPYLTYDQLRDWLRQGHEIGFHTHSHPFCSRLTDDLLESEVIAPVAALKTALGLPEVSLAYPFGNRCRPEHEQVLRERNVFTALIGTNGFSEFPVDPYAIERVEGEPNIDREVFGKPLLRSWRAHNVMLRHSEASG